MAEISLPAPMVNVSPCHTDVMESKIAQTILMRPVAVTHTAEARESFSVKTISALRVQMALIGFVMESDNVKMDQMSSAVLQVKFNIYLLFKFVSS